VVWVDLQLVMNNGTINNGFSVFGIKLLGGVLLFWVKSGCFFKFHCVSLDVIFQFRHVVYFIFINK